MVSHDIRSRPRIQKQLTSVHNTSNICGILNIPLFCYTAVKMGGKTPTVKQQIARKKGGRPTNFLGRVKALFPIDPPPPTASYTLL